MLKFVRCARHRLHGCRSPLNPHRRKAPIPTSRSISSSPSCPAARPTPSRGRFPTICRRRSASRSSSRTGPAPAAIIAWNHVASSDPDGYTLLLAENAVAISQALYKKSKSNFDPITQYDAVAGLAASPSALVVANNVPVKTVAELLAYSKTVPQKMNFASAGVGSVSHLNFEVFMDKTGMQAVHVPYKGGGQAIGDVIAGHVPMTITSVQAVKGLVESGKVKALAVTSPARSPAMPDVPTMQEAGVRAGRRRIALLVRDLRAEGPARCRSRPSSPRRSRKS